MYIYHNAQNRITLLQCTQKFFLEKASTVRKISKIAMVGLAKAVLGRRLLGPELEILDIDRRCTDAQAISRKGNSNSDKVITFQRIAYPLIIHKS